VSIGFDVPDIKLGVMMRKMAVRSLFYQQVGRLIRTAPGKEYAELLDIANNTATFGFHDEVYEPPEYGDKETLAKENAKLEAKTIKLITKEEPTEVTKELVLKKVEELERKKNDIPNIGFNDLLAIFHTSQDPLMIIRIGFEIHRRKTGHTYTRDNVEWAANPWYPFLEQFPQYQSRILRSLRTRVKNIVSQGKKLASIHYFQKWLSEQTPYIDYVMPDSVDVSEEVYTNYSVYDEVTMDEVPF
jgi:hypothetical protein